MALTDEQGGVLKRMMFGLLIALTIVIGSGVGNDRLAVAAPRPGTRPLHARRPLRAGGVDRIPDLRRFRAALNYC